MKLLSTLVLALFVLVLGACSQEKKQPGINQLKEHTPVLHAIDSSELRILMRRINNLMLERNLTQPEMDSYRQQALAQVIESANGVLKAIDRIIAAKPKLNLNPSEEQMFEKMALNLQEEANQLKQQAQSSQMEQVQNTLQNISATCNACHVLFRDFSKKGDAL